MFADWCWTPVLQGLESGFSILPGRNRLGNGQPGRSENMGGSQLSRTGFLVLKSLVHFRIIPGKNIPENLSHSIPNKYLVLEKSKLSDESRG